MWQLWENINLGTVLVGKTPKERDNLEEPHFDWRIILKIDLKQISWENPGLEHGVGGFEHDNALT